MADWIMVDKVLISSTNKGTEGGGIMVDKVLISSTKGTE